MKRAAAAILYILTGILVFLLSVLGFSSLWAFSTWGDIDMDEIVFQLQQPLQGAGGGMIESYLLKALLPAVLITVLFIVLIIFLKKGKRRILASCIVLALAAASALLIRNLIWERLDMERWISGRLETSQFVEENYVDPSKVKLQFPEKKRNLIYLYLESMETTYGDLESGGAFPENVIPELTRIAKENEDFSGAGQELNGAQILPGGGFTTGAIFAHSAGLPLRVSIGGNFMDTQTSFFPKVTALGDLLEQEGYRQVFLCGSEAVFGGRALFFTEHGNAEIKDYVYAKEQGLIEPDYHVFWGYEDEKLFSFAKEELKALSAGEQPFALTILTVDTHFEDGFVCRLCKEEFPGNPYANVMACSSRQVSDFLEWIRQQPFYENTAIVICGDHTTMDSNFCADVDPGYTRKAYTAFINPAAKPELPEKRRAFSTQDLFPTTLAALGVQIPGNRLALGTNLFSSEPTLIERFGGDRVKEEEAKRSALLEDLEKIDGVKDEELLARFQTMFQGSLSIDSYDPERKILHVRFANVYLGDQLADQLMGIAIERLELEYREKGKDASSVRFRKDTKEKDTYLAEADLSSWAGSEGELQVNLYLPDGSVYQGIDSLSFSPEEE